MPAPSADRRRDEPSRHAVTGDAGNAEVPGRQTRAAACREPRRSRAPSARPAPQPAQNRAAGKPRRAKPPRQSAGRKPAARAKPAGAAADRDGSAEAAREQVIADAARLVQWGRKWYELPELIARMADRPSLPEVRRILKENKSAIEKKAGAA